MEIEAQKKIFQDLKALLEKSNDIACERALRDALYGYLRDHEAFHHEVGFYSEQSADRYLCPHQMIKQQDKGCKILVIDGAADSEWQTIYIDALQAFDYLAELYSLTSDNWSIVAAQIKSTRPGRFEQGAGIFLPFAQKIFSKKKSALKPLKQLIKSKKKFDAIIVIECDEEREKLLLCIDQLLKDGGKLVFDSPSGALQSEDESKKIEQMGIEKMKLFPDYVPREEWLISARYSTYKKKGKSHE